MPLISINLLPKNLQRRREPGYWRLIAFALPILVFLVIGGLQVVAHLQLGSLERERAHKQATYDELRQYIQERDALLIKQRDLQAIIAIRDEVRSGQIIWSKEMAEMIETIPAPIDGEMQVSITTLGMFAIEGDPSDAAIYEGISADAYMGVVGVARDANTLAQYIRSLEESAKLAVVFESAVRDDALDTYNFTMNVGVEVEDVVSGEEE